MGRLEFRKGQDLGLGHKETPRIRNRRIQTRSSCSAEATAWDENATQRSSIRLAGFIELIPNLKIIPAKPREECAPGWRARSMLRAVAPSRADNYPNVILEAAQAGRHLVCSDGGGILEIMKSDDMRRALPSEDVSLAGPGAT